MTIANINGKSLIICGKQNDNK